MDSSDEAFVDLTGDDGAVGLRGGAPTTTGMPLPPRVRTARKSSNAATNTGPPDMHGTIAAVRVVVEENASAAGMLPAVQWLQSLVRPVQRDSGVHAGVLLGRPAVQTTFGILPSSNPSAISNSKPEGAAKTTIMTGPSGVGDAVLLGALAAALASPMASSDAAGLAPNAHALPGPHRLASPEGPWSQEIGGPPSLHMTACETIVGLELRGKVLSSSGGASSARIVGVGYVPDPRQQQQRRAAASAEAAAGAGEATIIVGHIGTLPHHSSDSPNSPSPDEDDSALFAGAGASAGSVGAQFSVSAFPCLSAVEVARPGQDATLDSPAGGADPSNTGGYRLVADASVGQYLHGEWSSGFEYGSVAGMQSRQTFINGRMERSACDAAAAVASSGRASGSVVRDAVFGSPTAVGSSSAAASALGVVDSSSSASSTSGAAASTSSRYVAMCLPEFQPAPSSALGTTSARIRSDGGASHNRAPPDAATSGPCWFMSAPSIPDLLFLGASFSITATVDLRLPVFSPGSAPSSDAAAASASSTAVSGTRGPQTILSTPHYGLGIDATGAPCCWLRTNHTDIPAQASAAGTRDKLLLPLSEWWVPSSSSASASSLQSTRAEGNAAGAAASVAIGQTALQRDIGIVVVTGHAPVTGRHCLSMDVDLARLQLVLLVDCAAVARAPIPAHCLPGPSSPASPVSTSSRQQQKQQAVPFFIGCDMELSIVHPDPVAIPGAGGSTATATAASFPASGGDGIAAAPSLPSVAGNGLVDALAHDPVLAAASDSHSPLNVGQGCGLTGASGFGLYRPAKDRYLYGLISDVMIVAGALQPSSVESSRSPALSPAASPALSVVARSPSQGAPEAAMRPRVLAYWPCRGEDSLTIDASGGGRHAVLRCHHAGSSSSSSGGGGGGAGEGVDQGGFPSFLAVPLSSAPVAASASSPIAISSSSWHTQLLPVQPTASSGVVGEGSCHLLLAGSASVAVDNVPSQSAGQAGVDSIATPVKQHAHPSDYASEGSVWMRQPVTLQGGFHTAVEVGIPGACSAAKSAPSSSSGAAGADGMSFEQGDSTVLRFAFHSATGAWQAAALNHGADASHLILRASGSTGTTASGGDGSGGYVNRDWISAAIDGQVDAQAASGGNTATNSGSNSALSSTTAAFLRGAAPLPQAKRRKQATGDSETGASGRSPATNKDDSIRQHMHAHVLPVVMPRVARLGNSDRDATSCTLAVQVRLPPSSSSASAGSGTSWSSQQQQEGMADVAVVLMQRYTSPYDDLESAIQRAVRNQRTSSVTPRASAACSPSASPTLSKSHNVNGSSPKSELDLDQLESLMALTESAGPLVPGSDGAVNMEIDAAGIVTPASAAMPAPTGAAVAPPPLASVSPASGAAALPVAHASSSTVKPVRICSRPGCSSPQESEADRCGHVGDDATTAEEVDCSQLVRVLAHTWVSLPRNGSASPDASCTKLIVSVRYDAIKTQLHVDVNGRVVLTCAVDLASALQLSNRGDRCMASFSVVRPGGSSGSATLGSVNGPALLVPLQIPAPTPTAVSATTVALRRWALQAYAWSARHQCHASIAGVSTSSGGSDDVTAMAARDRYTAEGDSEDDEAAVNCSMCGSHAAGADDLNATRGKRRLDADSGLSEFSRLRSGRTAAGASSSSSAAPGRRSSAGNAAVTFERGRDSSSSANAGGGEDPTPATERGGSGSPSGRENGGDHSATSRYFCSQTSRWARSLGFNANNNKQRRNAMSHEESYCRDGMGVHDLVPRSTKNANTKGSTALRKSGAAAAAASSASSALGPVGQANEEREMQHRRERSDSADTVIQSIGGGHFGSGAGGDTGATGDDAGGAGLVEDPQGPACPVCTFINNFGAKSCDMCHTTLTSSAASSTSAVAGAPGNSRSSALDRASHLTPFVPEIRGKGTVGKSESLQNTPVRALPAGIATGPVQRQVSQDELEELRSNLGLSGHGGAAAGGIKRSSAITHSSRGSNASINNNNHHQFFDGRSDVVEPPQQQRRLFNPQSTKNSQQRGGLHFDTKTDNGADGGAGASIRQNLSSLQGSNTAPADFVAAFAPRDQSKSGATAKMIVAQGSDLDADIEADAQINYDDEYDALATASDDGSMGAIAAVGEDEHDQPVADVTPGPTMHRAPSAASNCSDSSLPALMAPEPPPSPWSCEVCTFLHDKEANMTAVKCQMCETDRPTAPITRSYSPPPVPGANTNRGAGAGKQQGGSSILYGPYGKGGGKIKPGNVSGSGNTSGKSVASAGFGATTNSTGDPRALLEVTERMLQDFGADNTSTSTTAAFSTTAPHAQPSSVVAAAAASTVGQSVSVYAHDPDTHLPTDDATIPQDLDDAIVDDSATLADLARGHYGNKFMDGRIGARSEEPTVDGVGGGGLGGDEEMDEDLKRALALSLAESQPADATHSDGGDAAEQEYAPLPFAPTAAAPVTVASMLAGHLHSRYAKASTPAVHNIMATFGKFLPDAAAAVWPPAGASSTTQNAPEPGTEAQPAAGAGIGAASSSAGAREISDQFDKLVASLSANTASAANAGLKGKPAQPESTASTSAAATAAAGVNRAGMRQRASVGPGVIADQALNRLAHSKAMAATAAINDSVLDGLRAVPGRWDTSIGTLVLSPCATTTVSVARKRAESRVGAASTSDDMVDDDTETVFADAAQSVAMQLPVLDTGYIVHGRYGYNAPLTIPPAIVSAAGLQMPSVTAVNDRVAADVEASKHASSATGINATSSSSSTAGATAAKPAAAASAVDKEVADAYAPRDGSGGDRHERGRVALVALFTASAIIAGVSENASGGDGSEDAAGMVSGGVVGVGGGPDRRTKGKWRMVGSVTPDWYYFASARVDAASLIQMHDQLQPQQSGSAVAPPSATPSLAGPSLLSSQLAGLSLELLCPVLHAAISPLPLRMLMSDSSNMEANMYMTLPSASSSSASSSASISRNAGSQGSDGARHRAGVGIPESRLVDVHWRRAHMHEQIRATRSGYNTSGGDAKGRPTGFAGLMNLTCGLINACYQNALMQSLSMTDELRHMLLAAPLMPLASPYNLDVHSTTSAVNGSAAMGQPPAEQLAGAPNAIAGREHDEAAAEALAVALSRSALYGLFQHDDINAAGTLENEDGALIVRNGCTPPTLDALLPHGSKPLLSAAYASASSSAPGLKGGNGEPGQATGDDAGGVEDMMIDPPATAAAALSQLFPPATLLTLASSAPAVMSFVDPSIFAANTSVATTPGVGLDVTGVDDATGSGPAPTSASSVPAARGDSTDALARSSSAIGTGAASAHQKQPSLKARELARSYAIANRLQWLFARLAYSQRPWHGTFALKRVLQSEFRGNGQQDVVEFCNSITGAVDDAWKARASASKSLASHTTASSEGATRAAAGVDADGAEQGVFEHLFGGVQATVRTCLQCKPSTVKNAAGSSAPVAGNAAGEGILVSSPRRCGHSTASFDPFLPLMLRMPSQFHPITGIVAVVVPKSAGTGAALPVLPDGYERVQGPDINKDRGNGPYIFLAVTRRSFGKAFEILPAADSSPAADAAAAAAVDVDDGPPPLMKTGLSAEKYLMPITDIRIVTTTRPYNAPAIDVVGNIPVAMVNPARLDSDPSHPPHLDGYHTLPIDLNCHSGTMNRGDRVHLLYRRSDTGCPITDIRVIDGDKDPVPTGYKKLDVDLNFGTGITATINLCISQDMPITDICIRNSAPSKGANASSSTTTFGSGTNTRTGTTLNFSAAIGPSSVAAGGIGSGCATTPDGWMMTQCDAVSEPASVIAGGPLHRPDALDGSSLQPVAWSALLQPSPPAPFDRFCYTTAVKGDGGHLGMFDDGAAAGIDGADADDSPVIDTRAKVPITDIIAVPALSTLRSTAAASLPAPSPTASSTSTASLDEDDAAMAMAIAASKREHRLQQAGVSSSSLLDTSSANSAEELKALMVSVYPELAPYAAAGWELILDRSSSGAEDSGAAAVTTAARPRSTSSFGGNWSIAGPAAAGSSNAAAASSAAAAASSHAPMADSSRRLLPLPINGHHILVRRGEGCPLSQLEVYRGTDSLLNHGASATGGSSSSGTGSGSGAGAIGKSGSSGSANAGGSSSGAKAGGGGVDDASNCDYGSNLPGDAADGDQWEVMDVPVALPPLPPSLAPSTMTANLNAAGAGVALGTEAAMDVDFDGAGGGVATASTAASLVAAPSSASASTSSAVSIGQPPSFVGLWTGPSGIAQNALVSPCITRQSPLLHGFILDASCGIGGSTRVSGVLIRVPADSSSSTLPEAGGSRSAGAGAGMRTSYAQMASANAGRSSMHPSSSSSSSSSVGQRAWVLIGKYKQADDDRWCHMTARIVAHYGHEAATDEPLEPTSRAGGGAAGSSNSSNAFISPTLKDAMTQVLRRTFGVQHKQVGGTVPPTASGSNTGYDTSGLSASAHGLTKLTICGRFFDASSTNIEPATFASTCVLRGNQVAEQDAMMMENDAITSASSSSSSASSSSSNDAGMPPAEPQAAASASGIDQSESTIGAPIIDICVVRGNELVPQGYEKVLDSKLRQHWAFEENAASYWNSDIGDPVKHSAMLRSVKPQQQLQVQQQQTAASAPAIGPAPRSDPEPAPTRSALKLPAETDTVTYRGTINRTRDLMPIEVDRPEMLGYNRNVNLVSGNSVFEKALLRSFNASTLRDALSAYSRCLSALAVSAIHVSQQNTPAWKLDMNRIDNMFCEILKDSSAHKWTEERIAKLKRCRGLHLFGMNLCGVEDTHSFALDAERQPSADAPTFPVSSAASSSAAQAPSALPPAPAAELPVDPLSLVIDSRTSNPEGYAAWKKCVEDHVGSAVNLANHLVLLKLNAGAPGPQQDVRWAMAYNAVSTLFEKLLDLRVPGWTEDRVARVKAAWGLHLLHRNMGGVADALSGSITAAAATTTAAALSSQAADEDTPVDLPHLVVPVGSLLTKADGTVITVDELREAAKAGLDSSLGIPATATAPAHAASAPPSSPPLLGVDAGHLGNGDLYLCVKRGWPASSSGKASGHSSSPPLLPIVDVQVVVIKASSPEAVAALQSSTTSCGAPRLEDIIAAHVPVGYELIRATPSGLTANFLASSEDVAAGVTSSNSSSNFAMMFVAVKRLQHATAAEAAMMASSTPVLMDVDVLYHDQDSSQYDSPMPGFERLDKALTITVSPVTAPSPSAVASNGSASAEGASAGAEYSVSVKARGDSANLNADTSSSGSGSGSGKKVFIALRKGICIPPAAPSLCPIAGTYFPSNGHHHHQNDNSGVVGEGLSITSVRGPVPLYFLSGERGPTSNGGAVDAKALASRLVRQRKMALNDAMDLDTGGCGSADMDAALGVQPASSSSLPPPSSSAVLLPADPPVLDLSRFFNLHSNGPTIDAGRLLGVALPGHVALELQHAAEGGVLSRIPKDAIAASLQVAAATAVAGDGASDSSDKQQNQNQSQHKKEQLLPWYVFGMWRKTSSSPAPLSSAGGYQWPVLNASSDYAAATAASRVPSSFELVFLPSAATLPRNASMSSTSASALVEARGYYSRPNDKGCAFPWRLQAQHVLRMAWKRDTNALYRNGRPASAGGRVDATTLDSMLSHHTRTSILSHANQVHCSSCGHLTDHATTTAVVNPPKHLFVHIARMGYDVVRQRAVKSHAHVPLQSVLVLPAPEEGVIGAIQQQHSEQGQEKTLRVSVADTNTSAAASTDDIGAAASPPPPVTTAPRAYGLYSVIVHSGESANSGHYYCYSRRSDAAGGDLSKNDDPASPWMLFNDQRVGFMRWADINAALSSSLSDSAYVLLYRQLRGEQAVGAVNEWSAKQCRAPVAASSPVPAIGSSSAASAPAASSAAQNELGGDAYAGGGAESDATTETHGTTVSIAHRMRRSNIDHLASIGEEAADFAASGAGSPPVPPASSESESAAPCAPAPAPWVRAIASDNYNYIFRSLGSGASTAYARMLQQAKELYHDKT